MWECLKEQDFFETMSEPLMAFYLAKGGVPETSHDIWSSSPPFFAVSLRLVPAHILSAVWALTVRDWTVRNEPMLAFARVDSNTALGYIPHSWLIHSPPPRKITPLSCYFPNQEGLMAPYRLSQQWTSMLSNLSIELPIFYSVYFLTVPHSFLQLFIRVSLAQYCTHTCLCKITSVSDAYSFYPHPSRLCPNPTPDTLQTPPLAMVSFFSHPVPVICL